MVGVVWGSVKPYEIEVNMCLLVANAGVIPVLLSLNDIGRNGGHANFLTLRSFQVLSAHADGEGKLTALDVNIIGDGHKNLYFRKDFLWE